MDWLIEPFEVAAQQRALLGGVVAALMLALVGTWVVIRGMTFLGDALAHGVIPGIALAILFDVNLLVGAIVAALVIIYGIGLVHRQTAFSEDTGIGLLFVGMLSAGVMILSRLPNYDEELTDLLFGEVAEVSSGQIVILSVMAVITLVVSVVFYRPFLVLAFNEQKAQMLGMRPKLAHGVLLTLITAAIVSSFQMVGTLLVFGLLVGPAATAALLVQRVPAIMATASVLGVGSVAAGLIISYHTSTAASATMSFVSIALFFVVLAAKSASTGRQVQG
jgi:ABC-type Mn2+/Zn2+ transport system permease subunit